MATGRKDRDGLYRKHCARLKAETDVCYLCLTPGGWTLPRNDPRRLTVDAIFPTQRGGDHNDLDNLAVAHAACNSAKGTKLLSELRLPFAPPVLRPPGARGRRRPRSWAGEPQSRSVDLVEPGNW